MKLWLAQFKLERYRYMEGSTTDEQYTFRLIKGKDKAEVEEKIKSLFEYGSQGGDARSVVDFEANECIE